MKNCRSILALVASFTLVGLFAFKSIDHKADGITIYQKGKEIAVGQEEEVSLYKHKFSIRFSNNTYNSSEDKFYSAKIAAFLDKSSLSKIQVGMSTQNIPCFETGSGMAPSLKGFYDSIIFNEAGHHYLYYANKKDKRVNLISDKSEMLRLEFPINKLYLDGQDTKLAKADISAFYLAILIDKNLNNVIDEGELTKLTIRLK